MNSSPRSRSFAGQSYRHAKKVVIAVIGGSVMLLGVALIFLPGPAFLVIPAGLAILATEFAWARLWLLKAKQWAPWKNRKGAVAAIQNPTPGKTNEDSTLPGAREPTSSP